MDYPVPELRASEVAERFDAVLLDAYGVLVDGRGALPGAAAFLQALDAARLPWMIVSNDASRSVEAATARYGSLGLRARPEQILLSAALIAPHYTKVGLVGARTIVLGPPDSTQWVRDAGGQPVDWDHPEPEAVVVCDDAGYPFIPAVEAVISTVARREQQGHSVALVLPNPDKVYPSGDGEIGLTAGSAALVIEAALAAVLGADAPTFVGLGKPHAAIFDEACARLGHRGTQVVMLGDQVSTDIIGAHQAGLSAGLLLTGVTQNVNAEGKGRPDFVLRSLR